MVSMMTGPIPPHPYYDKSGAATYVDLPVPRVRPEARAFAQQAQGSVGVLLIEGHQAPANFRRTKTESKNHLNENVRRMRQIQREAKKREAGGVKPVKALWKSSMFESVPSKVSEELNREPLPPRPHTAHYLRAHSRTGWTPTPRPTSAQSSTSSLALTVPKAATAREMRLVRHDIDFVNLNGRSAKHTALQRSPSMTALDDLRKRKEDEDRTYRRGVLPKYLVSRRKQWGEEEEERRAAEPDPDMPAGHRAMPTAERTATLEKLKSTEHELMSQLQSLPIRTDTLRIRSCKEALDRKLAEVADAIRIFSRPKVFIKLDT